MSITPTVESNQKTYTIAFNPKEPKNQSSISTDSDVKNQSDGQIHPSLILNDEARRASMNLPTQVETPTFTKVIDEIVGRDGHKIVADILTRITKTNPDKQKYGQYLFNLHHDLKLIEGALAQLNLPIQTLPKIYCEERLINDLKHLEFKGDISNSLKKYDHEAYYRSMEKKPLVLLGHFTLHFLGFLAGGKFISTAAKTLWGEQSVHLYNFSPNGIQLRENFKKELDQYAKNLDPKEFNEFKIEIQNAWDYILDLVEHDARKNENPGLTSITD